MFPNKQSTQEVIMAADSRKPAAYWTLSAEVVKYSQNQLLFLAPGAKVDMNQPDLYLLVDWLGFVSIPHPSNPNFKECESRWLNSYAVGFEHQVMPRDAGCVYSDPLDKLSEVDIKKARRLGDGRSYAQLVHQTHKIQSVKQEEREVGPWLTEQQRMDQLFDMPLEGARYLLPLNKFGTAGLHDNNNVMLDLSLLNVVKWRTPYDHRQDNVKSFWPKALTADGSEFIYRATVDKSDAFIKAANTEAPEGTVVQSNLNWLLAKGQRPNAEWLTEEQAQELCQRTFSSVLMPTDVCDYYNAQKDKHHNGNFRQLKFSLVSRRENGVNEKHIDHWTLHQVHRWFDGTKKWINKFTQREVTGKWETTQEIPTTPFYVLDIYTRVAQAPAVDIAVEDTATTNTAEDTSIAEPEIPVSFTTEEQVTAEACNPPGK